MGLSFTVDAGPVSGPSPAGHMTTFTVSDSRLSQPGGPGHHIYIPQGQGGPVIPPDTRFPFIASYDSQGYGGGIRVRLHTGLTKL
jgi:hypothetical protein